MHLEKQVEYTQKNSYSTLNDFNSETRNIWMVCHGLGYLTPFFIKHFEHLDARENYIIAPQAPSKYYQDKSFKYVGASWFTRKYLEQETKNITNYLSAVYNEEIRSRKTEKHRLILFGYSQGVSAITRWVAHSGIPCDSLLLHSGGLPKELNSNHFDHLSEKKIVLAYGSEDEYLKGERLKNELRHYEKVFGQNFEKYVFEGKHEVNPLFIEQEARFS